MMSDVVAGVKADLAAREVPVEVLDGKEHVARDGAGNRIVFVESTDTFAPVARPGGNPRPVLIRVAGAEVRIWGVAFGGKDATPADHRATTNNLIHQFILALHKTAGASNLGYSVQSGQFNNEAEMQFGAEYILNIVAMVPIVDVPWPTVTGVQAEGPCNINLGGVLYPACGE